MTKLQKKWNLPEFSWHSAGIFTMKYARKRPSVSGTLSTNIKAFNRYSRVDYHNFDEILRAYSLRPTVLYRRPGMETLLRAWLRALRARIKKKLASSTCSTWSRSQLIVRRVYFTHTTAPDHSWSAHSWFRTVTVAVSISAVHSVHL